MDTKANLANRKKINELAIQHNKLTTLVAALLNEVNSLKRELHSARGGNMGESSASSNAKMNDYVNNRSSPQQMMNPNKFPNFSDLRAEDILKQLSINHSDN
jgi:outer membrane murein-binding lipoprotein Lpp